MNFSGLGVLNAAMLAGLAGMAIPIVIHLLSRRNDPIVDWGAMQFLEFSPRERRRLNLADLLLMLARMALLGLVAVALARPFWSPKRDRSGAETVADSGVRRDVVLILDGSSSMGRMSSGSTPRDRAIAWSRGFVKRLKPGDSVAVLVARDRVRPMVDPPSFDMARVDKALADSPAARGSSDLPAAIGEALRILEKTQNPARDIIILADGRRSAWRPGDIGRWSLLRDLRKRLANPPRIWAASFEDGKATDEESPPDGSVGPLTLSRSVLTPGLAVEVSAAIANAGPGSMTRPVELVVDGQPVAGTSRVVGPIPPGGKTPVTFRTTFQTPGSHLVAVRLAPDSDPLPVDDESARPVSVASALAVLLVDGEPSLEPLGGEVDFLRAALAPTGDPSPLVKASTVSARDFRAEMLKGKRVVVLANVDRISSDIASALGVFVESGGGLLVAPGDRTIADSLNDRAGKDGKGWLPAKLGPIKGDYSKRSSIAHPSPRTFDGPVMSSLAQGDAPAMGEADLFAYRILIPGPGTSVVARLDTGDPWVLERAYGKGRVAVIAGPVDAEGGTLPVNPDFVPWSHEMIANLASGGDGPRSLKPGEPLTIDLDPAPKLETLPLMTPSGLMVNVPVVRTSTSARVKYLDTIEPGIYRLDLPGSPGSSIYAAVVGDDRAADPSPLEGAEADVLSKGWPMSFESEPEKLAGRVFAVARGGRRDEFWHGLILAALGALCVEVWMTRRMARAQGLA